MSTLRVQDLEIMSSQIEKANGKLIDKAVVLSILHKKLKDADVKNHFVIDRIDGAAIKELISKINDL